MSTRFPLLPRLEMPKSAPDWQVPAAIILPASLPAPVFSAHSVTNSLVAATTSKESLSKPLASVVTFYVPNQLCFSGSDIGVVCEKAVMGSKGRLPTFGNELRFCATFVPI